MRVYKAVNRWHFPPFRKSVLYNFTNKDLRVPGSCCLKMDGYASLQWALQWRTARPNDFQSCKKLPGIWIFTLEIPDLQTMCNYDWSQCSSSPNICRLHYVLSTGKSSILAAVIIQTKLEKITKEVNGQSSMDFFFPGRRYKKRNTTKNKVKTLKRNDWQLL